MSLVTHPAAVSAAAVLSEPCAARRQSPRRVTASPTPALTLMSPPHVAQTYTARPLARAWILPSGSGCLGPGTTTQRGRPARGWPAAAAGVTGRSEGRAPARPRHLLPHRRCTHHAGTYLFIALFKNFLVSWDLLSLWGVTEQLCYPVHSTKPQLNFYKLIFLGFRHQENGIFIRVLILPWIRDIYCSNEKSLLLFRRTPLKLFQTVYWITKNKTASPIQSWK